MRDKWIRQLLDDWVPLALRAGLTPDAFQPGDSWHRRDARRAHLVLRLDGPQRSVIVKRIFAPVDQDRFRAAMSAQRRAEAALRGHPTANAPRILATDPEACICLMDCAPGETVDALCADTSDPMPALRRAGAWLAAFHKSAAQEQRRFQPGYMVDHIADLGRQVGDGTLKIRAPAAFLSHARQVPGWARSFDQGPTVSAVKHGDMNMRNILLDDHGCATGIDFSGQGPAPVGFDIARFLLNHAEVYGDLDHLKTGSAVTPAALAAFFEGYDIVGPADASVAFMLKLQLLIDWVRVPPEDKGSSMLHHIRFQRIRKLAEVAFG